eukprot:scaffold241752_cov18-Prasinocladus_malaysianus.AAC.1
MQHGTETTTTSALADITAPRCPHRFSNLLSHDIIQLRALLIRHDDGRPCHQKKSHEHSNSATPAHVWLSAVFAA